MDKASLAGALLGLTAIFGGAVVEAGIALATTIVYSHGAAVAFMVVFVGTAGAVCVQTKPEDLPKLKEGIGIIFSPAKMDYDGMYTLILDLAQKARREGILALEGAMNDVDNKFLEKALRLTIDGQEKSFIEDTLHTAILHELEETKACAKIFDAIGGFGPTIGIMGAVLGLMATMGRLDSGDIALIGAGIQGAFVATLYGVGLANIVALPVGNKIKRHGEMREAFLEMIMTGVIGISEGLNPMLIQEKLEPYVHGDPKAAEEAAG